MRACEVVPLAWDATGSVRDHPRPKPTGPQLSTTPELTIRNHPIPRHLPDMTPIHFLLAAVPLTTLPVAVAASPPTADAARPVAVAARPPTALATPLLAAASPPPAQAQAATWPLDPRPQVVHGFDLPAKPWLPGHRGVDLSGSPGQPVLAATSGTITYAGQLAGRGVIVISTGPRRTTYEPVVPSLTVGTAVTPGTVLGRLSAVGSHCAPATCLHWGLIQGKQYLNPLTLLPNRPVRLLPLTHATPDLPAPDLPARDQPSAAPRADPPDVQTPAPPRAHAAASTPPSGNRTGTATAIVATTAALTLGAGLMIKRH